jgi:hypothetical protein
MGSCAYICRKKVDSGNIQNLLTVRVNNDLSDDIQNKNTFISNINGDLNKKLMILNKNTTDRDLLSINQQKADSILEYFNQIKLNPENFKEESKEYDVEDIIDKYIESKDRILFIKNRFYNSLLESYVKRTPNSDLEIQKGINNESNINKFDKQFYFVKSTVQDPNESVWILLKEHKKVALNKILLTKISYLSLCVYPIENTSNIKVYFLFLQLKNN